MSKAARSPSLDMTSGSPFKLILTFSLPLIAGSALQQLYNMVDSMVVGKFVGNTALTAVGAAFPVIFMLSGFFMGLGSGAMIIISQYYGAGQHENLRKTVDTMYTGLIVGGIPFSIIGVLLTNPFLTMLNIPPDAREETFLYMVIVMGGLLGSLGYNCNAGILQGLGDSRTPLLFLAIACVLNIILDILLVVVVPLGVAGVAIATVVAQTFSWIFGILYINKKFPEIKIRPFNFKFDKRIFSQILRLGLPLGVQQSLFSLAAILMTRLVNSYGSAYAAGFNAANKLDTFAFLPIQGISTAATTYTGQNIGAGKTERVRGGIKASLGLCFLFCIIGLLVIPAGPFLMRLFTDDPLVVDAGMAFIYRIMPFYFLLAINFTINSVMRGAGESVIPLIGAMVNMWLARVPTAYLLAHFFGRDSMHFSYAIGWVFGLAISLPYFLTGKWKNKSITRAGNNPEKEPALDEGETDADNASQP